MKTGLVFNIVLLVLVGVLFYLHFSSKGKTTDSGRKVETVSAGRAETGTPFKIAYFELDSITNSFAMVKDVKTELNREEDKMTSEMAQWQRRYNEKINMYQGQAQQMSQVQSENANRDIMRMQEEIRSKKQELDQRYQNMYMQKMQEVRNRIQEYLKEYNKSGNYSYIFGYEPGFIYYRDTAYNITADLIKGLNDGYSTKKK